jgi:selenocysteine-specific elongation factor
VNDRAAAADDRAKALVREMLRESGLAGATAVEIGAMANMDQARVSDILGELLSDGLAIVVSKPHGYLDGEVGADILRRAIERLEQGHLERPWAMGLTSLGLARALTAPEPALVRVLSAYVDARCLAYRRGYYATSDFQPRLSADQRAFFDSVFGTHSDAEPLQVPFDQLRALMKASTAPELAQAFETLVADEMLIRIGDSVYRGAHIRAIRARLETALHRNGRITVAEFRDLAGTSRKYAVPLLEFFDAAGVTLRSGDVRMLRQPSAPKAGSEPV